MSDHDKKPVAADRFRRIYRIASTTVGVIAIAYLLLINFPQTLLAHSTTYGKFNVYSAQPAEPEIRSVLDAAEQRLQTSPLYDDSVGRRIYLTTGFGMYALLSNKAYGSFANSVPFVNNVIVNKTDVASDQVFIPRDKNNTRSLSGVIAHEITHLFIRQRYGTVKATMMPTWKNEGYCEYVAGSSTISFEEGLRLWRASPTDDTGYRYVKYHAMVRYLLDHEHITVDELFTRDFDEIEIASRTFDSLSSVSDGQSQHNH